MTFSERLISLRRQKGLSQEQLGEQIGVTRQTVSKWELGETTPEMEKLIQLSDIFDISIDQLVGRQASPEKKAEGGNNSAGSITIRPGTWQYEYKSKTTIGKLPLVHVHIGRGLYRAKGVIAVGTIAQGVVSLGIVSAGIFSLGCVSIGLISLGALCLGLLLAVGAIAVGCFAVGAVAIGIMAVGGLAVGMYSLGGCAIASRIAAGGYAQAPIAIGDKAAGDIVFDIHGAFTSGEVREAILQKFPDTWTFLADLFSRIF